MVAAAALIGVVVQIRTLSVDVGVNAATEQAHFSEIQGKSNDIIGKLNDQGKRIGVLESTTAVNTSRVDTLYTYTYGSQVQ